MDKDHHIKLTLAVHRVTDLFPEDDILKHDIRRLANKLLANLILLSHKHFQFQRDKAVENLKTLEDCLELAETKNLADSRNFLVLKREYKGVREEIEGLDMANPVPEIALEKPRNRAVSSNGKERQEKILEVLRGNGRTKVGDLIKIFPDVNRRTVLRDLENFSRAGLVERNGNGRGVCYIIKNS